MKPQKIFLLLVFFLASCTPSTPAPTATPAPTSTLTPIPTVTQTATSTPEAWVAIVDAYGMPADLPADAYFSEDGEKILSADGEEIYVLDKNEQGETNWIEAIPPIGETQPWMTDYVEAYSQMEGATLEAYVIEDYKYIWRPTASDYDALKITRDVPTEEMVRKFAALYDKNNYGLIGFMIRPNNPRVAGLFGGEIILLKEKGRETGRAETWVSILTVNNGPNGDGQVKKLWFSFVAGVDYSEWCSECLSLQSEAGEFLSVNDIEIVLKGGDPIRMFLGATTEFDYNNLTQEELDQILFMMSGDFAHLDVDLDQ